VLAAPPLGKGLFGIPLAFSMPRRPHLCSLEQEQTGRRQATSPSCSLPDPRRRAFSGMALSADKHLHSGSTGSSSLAASPAMTSAADTAGASLWAAEGAANSTMLPYVRDHADKMVARVRQEDPRVLYLALKQVHDVCLYKRLTQPQETLNVAMATATSPLGASLSSSFSSMASSSRRGLSLTRDPTEGVHVAGDFEFRGVTRVPGSVDMVLDFLAAESARENYWVALNTLRDLKAAALLSSARLQSAHSTSSSVTSETDADTTAFPRWSRKYTATRFSKHGAQVMDCCFAEYATRITETNSDGHSRRRGFVYRRSVSEHALSHASSVSAEPLAKARVNGAARFFIRDWLFDVIETQEPLVCKLILTCSVFAPTPAGRAPSVSRSDFRDFCTEIMAGARRALTHQLKDQAAHASMRSSSWRRDSRCCTVCSAQFSILRKRHTCRSCGSGVCSKCCLKTSARFTADGSRSGFGSSMVADARPQQHGNHKRECLLCAHFGPDDGVTASRSGGVTSRGRHLSSAMASMSASTSRGFAASSRGGTAFEVELEEIDQVHPDLDLRSTASVSGSRRQRSQRSIGSAGSQRSISGPDDDDDGSDEDVRPYTPRLDLRATTSKLRTESTDSLRSTRSAPGIVLLSDLETLTLSGSFHRATSMSSRASANFSASLSARSPANAASRLPAKSSAPTPAALVAQHLKQRQDRAASEDNVLLTAVKPRAGTTDGPQESSASTEEDEYVYTEDELANFTLKLL
jgi:hypothetical protein